MDKHAGHKGQAHGGEGTSEEVKVHVLPAHNPHIKCADGGRFLPKPDHNAGMPVWVSRIIYEEPGSLVLVVIRTSDAPQMQSTSRHSPTRFTLAGLRALSLLQIFPSLALQDA